LQGIAGNSFSAFGQQPGNKYVTPFMPGPPEFYSPLRPPMQSNGNGPNMQSNPVFYRGPNDPSLIQPMNMRYEG